MEKTTRLGRVRLLKLIEFISKLPRNQWNFHYWTTFSDPGCGTIHCAGGWCPTIWPNQWEWRESPVDCSTTVPLLIRRDNTRTRYDLMDFFSISEDICGKLFYPYKGIYGDCTPQEWAEYATEIVNDLEVI